MVQVAAETIQIRSLKHDPQLQEIGEDHVKIQASLKLRTIRVWNESIIEGRSWRNNLRSKKLMKKMRTLFHFCLQLTTSWQIWTLISIQIGLDARAVLRNQPIDQDSKWMQRDLVVKRHQAKHLTKNNTNLLKLTNFQTKSTLTKMWQELSPSRKLIWIKTQKCSHATHQLAWIQSLMVVLWASKVSSSTINPINRRLVNNKMNLVWILHLSMSRTSSRKSSSKKTCLLTMRAFKTIKVTTKTWTCNTTITKRATTHSTTTNKKMRTKSRCKTASREMRSRMAGCHRFSKCRIWKATKFLIHNQWKEGLSSTTSRRAWIRHCNRISRTNLCRYLMKVVILSNFKTINCLVRYMEEATQAASTRSCTPWLLSLQFRIVCLAIAMANSVLFQEANYSVIEMAKDLEVEQSLVDLKSEAILLRQGITSSSALVWIQMA